MSLISIPRSYSQIFIVLALWLRRAEVALIEQDSETWVLATVTDRNGDFAFYRVRAGKYFLEA